MVRIVRGCCFRYLDRHPRPPIHDVKQGLLFACIGMHAFMSFFSTDHS